VPVLLALDLIRAGYLPNGLNGAGQGLACMAPRPTAGPETGLRSRRHHQHHIPGAPAQLERHETPDPVRSNAVDPGFQCARRPTPDARCPVSDVRRPRPAPAPGIRARRLHPASAPGAQRPRPAPSSPPALRVVRAAPRLLCICAAFCELHPTNLKKR